MLDPLDMGTERREKQVSAFRDSFQGGGAGEQLTTKETVASGSESCMVDVILY